MDSSAPATKADVHMLMEEIGKLYLATERWKDEMVEHMQSWKDELKDHFNLVSEQNRHDIRDMFNDRISLTSDRLNQHDLRITRLETNINI